MFLFYTKTYIEDEDLKWLFNPKLLKIGLQFFNVSKYCIISPKKCFVKNGMLERAIFIHSTWLCFLSPPPPQMIHA